VTTAACATWPLPPEPDPSLRVLLVNPYARGAHPAAVRRVAELLGVAGRAIRVIGRDGPGRALAAEAVRARVGRVIAAGGDGTLHEVVQEVAGTVTALGVIPLGTSNDLALRVGVPLDLAAACAVALNGDVDAVDVLSFGDRRIATVGGFGLPATIARTCNELRAGPARSVARALRGDIYTVVTAAEILARGPRPVPVTLRPDRGAPAISSVSAVLVGLSERFGGGIRLTAGERMVPGTFVALVVTARSRAELLGVLLRLKTGRPVRHGARLITGLTNLDLRSAGPIGAFGDGEWLGVRRRAAITVERQALRVLVPRGRATAAAEWREAV
jgi:diacylglycerol kinase (ATP)